MATKAPTAQKRAPARKAEAPKTAPAPTPAAAPTHKSPEDIVLEEYGIDDGCFIIPRLLYCILCELVRGRSNG